MPKTTPLALLLCVTSLATLAALAVARPAVQAGDPGQGQEGGSSGQKGQDGPETPPKPSASTPPFTAFREAERARLEAALPGVWTIVTYEAPGRSIDQQRVEGYVFFQDGFASVVMQVQSFEAGITGQELKVLFQGTVHRYRISDLLKLQFASVMGFSNMNEDSDQIEFISNFYVREHSIDLQGDQMTLINEAGGRMTLRRVHGGAFPERASDFLRHNPGGIPVDKRR